MKAADLEQIKKEIRSLSECNAVMVREIVLHFQTLRSANAQRFLMDAPGLYYPELPLYVISKSGMARGHVTLHQSIRPLLPDGKLSCYGFVLYPESFVRTCLDRVLRRTTRNITPDLRVSMENIFNKKYHHRDLFGSDIEKQLIALLQRDLGVVKRYSSEQI